MKAKKVAKPYNINNKEQKEAGMSSFTINYKYQSDPQYPYLLANNLNRSDEQFEQTRSMKMLGEWVEQYAKLSQILKYKYTPYIPKVQKILLEKYEEKMNIDFCLSRFLIHFFSTWRQITSAIKKDLVASDKYALDFLWYTCHSLVEDMNLLKFPGFLEYLNEQYQESLRRYQPEQSIEARKIIQIVYLLNIHGCQPPFEKQVINWSLKFKSFIESASAESKNVLIVAVIKNKNVLQAKENSYNYWEQLVKVFLLELETRIPKMSKNNPSDRHLLDLFIWLLELKEVRQILLADQPRYLKSLLANMRIKEEQPDYIFGSEKYKDLLMVLYKLFFFTDANATKNRLGGILQKFTGHSYFVLNDSANYTFMDCLTQHPIKLEQSVITDIIKVMSNNHVRRTLPAKVLMVLAQTISASLDSCQLSEQVVGQCLKAFNDAMYHKSKDLQIGQLRNNIAKLFLTIMQRYQWEDGYKNQVIFNLCEESLRNSPYVSQTVFEILYLLIKKFGFCNETKIEPIIVDIFYKTLASEEQLHSLISLLVTVALHIKFPKATSFIQQVCAKNLSKNVSFYNFQALALARDNFPTESDFNTISQMICQKGYWEENRIDINLMMLQVYFMKASLTQSVKNVRKVDKNIQQLFKDLYTQGKYRLLTLIAGKILPALGGDPETLESFSCYRWLRQYSFDILARSFYKSTSINVCYVFSLIILRSQSPDITVRWLERQQFLDYLYQGLNDFISKQKQFTLEIATTILFFKLIKKYPFIAPSNCRLADFSTLVKNVSWWDQVNNHIHFSSFDVGFSDSCTLPDFISFYESMINNFFKNYFLEYAEKLRKAEQIEHNAHEEDI